MPEVGLGALILPLNAMIFWFLFMSMGVCWLIWRWNPQRWAYLIYIMNRGVCMSLLLGLSWWLMFMFLIQKRDWSLIVILFFFGVTSIALVASARQWVQDLIQDPQAPSAV